MSQPVLDALQAGHQKSLDSLVDGRDDALTSILIAEGISEKVLTSIFAALGIVLKLALTPEITVTKVVAAAIAIGVGAFVAYLIVKVIFTSIDKISEAFDSFENSVQRQLETYNSAVLEACPPPQLPPPG